LEVFLVNVRFRCPNCEAPARLELPGPSEWQCPACGHRLALHVGQAFEPDGQARKPDLPGSVGGLQSCAVCGNPELYRKKNFPHKLGLTILTLGFLASIELYRRYMIWLMWTILLGTWAFDVLLYCLVGDVVVCYRCLAHYRRLPDKTAFPPYE